ncbi:MAG: hypothetical protein MZV70_08625 [Desulfobacterales bacterium]|nr:hypothetical protein [Desulfobacterales bacterium]
MLAGAAADVTEHKLFQKALIESHARFVTVLDGIDADIYVADMDTHEVLFREPAHRGRASERDLIGQEMLGGLSAGSRPLPAVQQPGAWSMRKETLGGGGLGKQELRSPANGISTTTGPSNGWTAARCACRSPPTSPA